MGKLVLYAAASLDGFIARPDGGIDWLTRFNSSETDYGYSEFYAGVQAVLMGRKTYEAAAEAGPWPYDDRPCYVLSRSRASLPRVQVLEGDMGQVVADLEARHGTVWLVGGGTLVQQSLARGVLDQVILTLIPVALGSGIRLFDGPFPETWFSHGATLTYPGGLVQVSYDTAGNAGAERRRR